MSQICQHYQDNFEVYHNEIMEHFKKKQNKWKYLIFDNLLSIKIFLG